MTFRMALAVPAIRRLSRIAVALTVIAAASPAFAQSQTDAPRPALPSFVDERRLPIDGEAEARRRAAEEALKKLETGQEELRKKVESESEARRKAEEAAARRAEEERQQREAAAAEARRKAEAEAAAKRAEEERQQREAAAAEARRKAEAEAAAKRAEEERQQREAAAAEARRKAEAEAAAKRAEEERQQREAAAAEARRKAEAEAAAKRAEEERQQREAAAAEARRKAEAEAAAKRAEDERQRREAAAVEARRNAEEAEAMRKAEDDARRNKAAAEQLATRMAGSGDCNDVRVNSSNRAAAAVAITIAAPCLAGQKVTITYGRHSFVRAVPAGGNFNFVLDLFEGAAPVAVTYGEGKRADVDISGADWSGVSKVAVVWSAPVNLDLHALEYLAPRGSPGHVWAKSPGNPEAARAAVAGGDKGRGYMSVVDDGRGEGMKAEVYTFLHKTGQKSGAVTLLIDYESRGDRPTADYCGNGKLATVEATVIRLRPGGRVDREVVRLGPAQCNQPITDGDRYNSDTLSDLVARG